MKKTVFPLLFFLLSYPVVAQQARFDSLVTVALHNRYKIIKATAINRDSLFNLLPSARSYSQRIRLIFMITGNGLDFARQGLTYHYKILRWAKSHNDKVSEAVMTSELGYNFYQNGDNTQGIKIIFQALKMAEETGNQQALGIIYQNLATCYLSDQKLSKTYMLKALQFSRAAHDTLYTINALQGLGRKYYQEHKPDSGNFCYLKALSLSVKKNVPEYTCATLAYIASVETDDKQELKYLQAREAIAMASGNPGTISHADDGLANYYLKRRPDSALFYARKANNYAPGLSYASQIRPVIVLRELFDGRNADSALKYAKLYIRLHDSTNNIKKMQDAQVLAFNEQQRQQQALKQKEAYQNRQRLYLLGVVIAFLSASALILWRNSRQKQRANKVLENALAELKQAQNQLVQSAKMASLGELTAGIAHEIQNPLNFVNNFSEVSAELIDEMDEELDKGDLTEAKAISADIKQNLEKIRHHGKRADGIVKGMLEHSRASSGQKESIDINSLADEYLRLAYHGLRTKDKEFNAELVTSLDSKLGNITVIPQDIGRVLLNVINNAFYAVQQKAKTAGPDYKPAVTVSTAQQECSVLISIRDNGMGIPDNIREKIMQPFFTTKPTGEGTGLGLSLSYDIVVKGHGGTINVKSEEGAGSEFCIVLPV